MRFPLRTFIFVVTTVASTSVFAADNTATTTTTAPMTKAQLEEINSHYPTMFQLSFLGGMALGDLSGPAAAGDSAESYKTAVLVDVGRGSYTFQTGAELLSFATSANVSDPNGIADDQRYRVNSQWVGIPLVAKYNYIERPQASFSLKLGVMPAFMITNPNIAVTASDGTNVTNMYGHLNTFDAMALTGFTGVAPISDWVSFVLDGTFYYGTLDADGSGAHNKAIFLSAGFRFNL